MQRVKLLSNLFIIIKIKCSQQIFLTYFLDEDRIFVNIQNLNSDEIVQL
jgi:hypothetical protein